MTADQIRLARAAVVAKVAYWDALRTFELDTTSDGEWADKTNDAVIEAVDNLAGCAGDTADDPEYVSDDDINTAFALIFIDGVPA